MASRLPGKFALPLGLEIWASYQECYDYVLLVSYFRTMWGNAIDDVIDAAILVVSEEFREIVRGKRRKCGRRCRNWIALGESLGASNCLFRELSSYLLTAWSRVLLEKLTGSAASQEIPRIFGTRRFITVPTSARHLPLS